jgi:cyclophilin family peptidyl-prolyl cis-trans isomerase
VSLSHRPTDRSWILGICHVEVRRDVRPQVCRPDPSADLGVTNLTHDCRSGYAAWPGILPQIAAAFRARFFVGNYTECLAPPAREFSVEFSTSTTQSALAGSHRMKSVRRIGAAALVLLVVPAAAQAQIMRFDTSVGVFDMELNPTNDANLRPLVDNMVAYIGLGRYHYTAINRAAEDFVLQMGSFLGFPPTPDNYLGLIQEIHRLSPVVVDANNDGTVDFTAQSNTRGTVSLALSSAGPNSGTSSFFINLGDNSSLDSQGFVPFARINDMTTIDRIMALEQTNLSGDPNDLTFKDTPLLENGRLVILKSVRVLQAAPDFSFTGPIAAALAAAPDTSSADAASLLSSASDEAEAVLAGIGEIDSPGDEVVPSIEPPTAAVPEPASAALLALGVLAAAGRLRRAGRSSFEM